MRHLVKGRKLTRTSSHKKALMKNLATSLFEHKRITTTEAKAKELRPYAEKLITKAKTALKKEKQGLLPEGHTVDVHSRRIVGKHIRNKAVLQELFDNIAPAVETRDGGYTRIIKLGFRRGDGGREAMIELVDFGAPQDGVGFAKKKRVARPKKAAVKDVKPVVAPKVEAAPIVEEVPAPVEAEAHVAAPEAQVVDTPATDAPTEENKA